MNKVTALVNTQLKKFPGFYRQLHPDTQLIAIISGFYHLILLLLVVIAILVVQKQPFSLSLLKPLHSWDGTHYLFIAEVGYPRWPQIDANVIAFFPLYPALIAMLSVTGLPYLVSGLLITLFGSYLGHVGLFELARIRFGTQVAWRSFWFLLISPIAMYFTSTHTEGLFLGLTVLFFILLDKKRFWLAGVVGLAASSTRLPGITLIIPLLFSVISQSEHRTRKLNYVGLLLIPAGYLVYLFINWQVFGDPFYYQQVLATNWSKTIANPLRTIPDSFVFFVQGLTKQFDPSDLSFLFDIGWIFALPIIGGLFLLASGRFPLGWWGWMIANWLIIVSQSYWLSSTRYILILFPIYIMLGFITKKLPWLFILVSLILLVFLLYGMQRYILGHWVY